MTETSAPQLLRDVRGAVLRLGLQLQIVTSTGSRETGVVAQRVADLIATGTGPAGTSAFTFAERRIIRKRQNPPDSSFKSDHRKGPHD